MTTWRTGATAATVASNEAFVFGRRDEIPGEAWASMGRPQVGQVVRSAVAFPEAVLPLFSDIGEIVREERWTNRGRVAQTRRRRAREARSEHVGDGRSRKRGDFALPRLWVAVAARNSTRGGGVVRPPLRGGWADSLPGVRKGTAAGGAVHAAPRASAKVSGRPAERGGESLGHGPLHHLMLGFPGRCARTSLWDRLVSRRFCFEDGNLGVRRVLSARAVAHA